MANTMTANSHEPQDVESVDPRTADSVEVVAQTSTADSVADTVARAEAAGRRYAVKSPGERADLLDALAEALEAAAGDLVPLADRESALGETRLKGELARTTNQLRLFAEVCREGSFLQVTIDHPRPDAVPPVPDLRQMLLPVGPVVVFGASNFPFGFSAAGGDTAAALGAGCAVVVKAHGAHPGLDRDVVAVMDRVLKQHGLEGLVGVVFGRQAGLDLVDDPRVQAVGFTGSGHVGRLLMDRAAARPRPIPVYAEMGSLNPLIVTPGAVAGTKRASALADGIAGSVLLGHGQFCTKPGLIFVPQGSDGDVLVEQLGKRVDGASQQVMLSSAIRDSFRTGVESLQDVPGATAVVVGGDPDGPGSAAAALTTVDAKTMGDAAEDLLVETFGPASLVVRYQNMEELVKALESVPPSLTFTIHAAPKEGDAERALVTALRDVGSQQAGRVLFGGFPTGVAVSWAQTHAGPYPAAAGLFTSVGATAVRRFQRPVSYQTWPEALLPAAVQEENPFGLPRRVDGALQPSP